jgi:hypothetical protein
MGQSKANKKEELVLPVVGIDTSKRREDVGKGHGG